MVTETVDLQINKSAPAPAAWQQRKGLKGKEMSENLTKESNTGGPGDRWAGNRVTSAA